MQEFKKMIDNIEDVKRADLLFYAVEKEEIKNRDYSRILKSLEILKKARKDAREKLMITFNGYDEDKREIYAIPEIREFVRYIFNQYSYIFYFLTPLDNNRAIIFACLNDFKSLQFKDKKDVYLEVIYNKEIKSKTIDEMLKYGLLLDDLDETQRILFTFI